ncbi:HDOD domain-containing protein [Rubripirellula sp.]|nr:HDOD domain-containing protein [Rubripirellula sp.]MDB4633794.1 HDOD domain-containing protein [Rubripirellula sp.]
MLNTPTSTATQLSQRIEQAKIDFTLPPGARRLIAAGDFKGRTNDTLVRWLETDEEVATRLLKWCNTPLFNMSRPYETLAEAERIMEHDELARLAVVTFTRQLFLPNIKVDLFERTALWTHSMSVAAVASMISRSSGSGDPGLIFIAGAMHDIGICASQRLGPDSFREVIAQVDDLSPAHAVERELLGWDHGQLGEAILEQWGLSEEIQAVARHHHDADQHLDSPHAEAICCVAIANYLCSRSGRASIGSNNLDPPSNAVFQRLNIDAGLLTILGQQLYAALNSASELN